MDRIERIPSGIVWGLMWMDMTVPARAGSASAAALLLPASLPPRPCPSPCVCSPSLCAPHYSSASVLHLRCAQCSRHHGVQVDPNQWRKGWVLFNKNPEAGSGSGQPQVMFTNLCKACNQAWKRKGGSVPP